MAHLSLTRPFTKSQMMPFNEIPASALPPLRRGRFLQLMLTIIFLVVLIYSSVTFVVTLKAHHELRSEERAIRVAKLENRIDWLCSRNPQWRMCNG